MYSALCWHSLRAPQPGGRRKASSLGSRPLPLHPSAENPQSLRGFPKQPSVCWKSKGQNPEFWPAGPALLLALCRPAGPGAPARMGLAVQGTLKSLLQHRSLKASILQCTAFFMVQLSHPYMITGKTIALTRWIFVGKVTSLLFNMLSSVFSSQG